MASSLPRPKRAGESFARTNHDQDDSPDNKKPRFDLRNPSALAADAPEEDAVLDADEIGRRGQNVRRKAVNLDGYDSDSDNEGFSARKQEKSKKIAKDADDDDDMFAELQDDFDENKEDDDEASRKKKSVRFLRDNEIEGQESDSKGGKALRADLSKAPGEIDDEEEDEDSGSDVGEEERARIDEDLDEEVGAGGKKKHAPLLDAFNMRTEQEEGQFDESGNYVRKAVDPDAVYDSWLDGLSKKDIQKAKDAAAKRESDRKEQDRMNDSVLTADVLKTIILHLERGETILEALARLGKGLQRKPKWQNKKKNKKSNTEDTEMTDENPDEAKRRKAIDDITGAADILMGRDQPEIFDTERELLTRQYRNETGEDWVDPPSEGDAQVETPMMWEYRWSDARDGGDAHGPYDSTMMASWNSAGYFGEGVEFRQVGSTGPWSSTVSFV
ncbi:hypothetical protein N7520_008210 [Penicillium odoratum]|uniref:uncharacterized protein n=1 Tax=Penicillium odoratum TaxID=1167516 RepID=UPI002547B772|nr:uncharacterized protein N7520_008210 [Penicillium odoratum]KAJ5761054.1 hypothetical protein N7520_008210 [Penicillium odoratum]